MLAFNPEQKKIYKENLDLLYDVRVLDYRENHLLRITEWKLVIAARRSYLRGILKYAREKKMTVPSLYRYESVKVCQSLLNVRYLPGKRTVPF